MSTGNQHVRYSRGVRADGGEKNKAEIRELEAHATRTGSQKTSRRARKKHSAKRRDVRVIAAVLGTFLLLTLTSTGLRYISVTVQRDELKIKLDELNEEMTELKSQCSDDRRERNATERGSFTNITEVNNTSNATEKGNGCPPGWVKVGCSCYYEYIIVSALQKSQEDCEKKGGMLIVVNSIEKKRILEGETPKDGLLCGSAIAPP
ncbi:C-type lectin domain family 9 member A-like isoform X2 [Astatotilapia calliptera]|uniref:C-type lectin domain family 9 member A-like isoform X2 n=1 Tax=Astatotilapia calliptera TaxID=8154 RepID=UPI000E4110FC|nr:C-type lectin domain family 9 member A-like isoform X2 [Astatotilapia calliptera]